MDLHIEAAKVFLDLSTCNLEKSASKRLLYRLSTRKKQHNNLVLVSRWSCRRRV